MCEITYEVWKVGDEEPIEVFTDWGETVNFVKNFRPITPHMFVVKTVIYERGGYNG